MASCKGKGYAHSRKHFTFWVENKNPNQAQWCMPVAPAMAEAEAEDSLDSRNLTPTWSYIVRLHSKECNDFFFKPFKPQTEIPSRLKQSNQCALIDIQSNNSHFIGNQSIVFSLGNHVHFIFQGLESNLGPCKSQVIFLPLSYTHSAYKVMFVFCFVVLEIKPCALYILSKGSITELHPQPNIIFLRTFYDVEWFKLTKH